jgi:outer membrane protein TolC
LPDCGDWSSDVCSSDLEVIRTEGAIPLALDGLRLVLAEEAADLDVAGTLDLELPAAPAAPAADEAVQAALDHRPDLRGLGRSVEVRREYLGIVDADDKPRLDLQAGAGWRWLDFGPGIAASSGNGRTLSAALVLSFPFFDGLATRGRVQQAESDLARSRLDLSAARDGVAIEVRRALEQVRVADETLRALSGTVGQARRLLEMAEKGQELGVKTRLEVDDALLGVRQAEANLARARRDHLVALTDLAYAQGAL